MKFFIISILLLSSVVIRGQSNLFEVRRMDSLMIDSTWTIFVKAILEKDHKMVKRLSMKEINCTSCLPIRQMHKSYNKLIPVKFFLKESTYIFDEKTTSVINSQKYHLIKREEGVCRGAVENKRVFYEIVYQIYGFGELGKEHEGMSKFFQFIKVNGQFRFYGYLTMP